MNAFVFSFVVVVVISMIAAILTSTSETSEGASVTMEEVRVARSQVSFGGSARVVPASACSLCCFYDQVYVGTRDGRVRLLDGGGGVGAAGHPTEHRIPGGRPVSQLLCLGELGLIVALSGGNVHVIDAQKLSAVHDSGINVKGQVAYMAVNESAVPDFSLCLATAHKLHLFQLVGNTHRAWKTLNIPSPSSQLVWSGHTICAVVQDQIILVDVPSGNYQRVYELSGSRSGVFVRVLANGRFLMCIDGLGIIIKHTSEPCGNTLVWSSSPDEVICTSGFVVTILDRTCRINWVGFEERDEEQVEEEVEEETFDLPEKVVCLTCPNLWNAPAVSSNHHFDLKDFGGIFALTDGSGDNDNNKSILRFDTMSVKDFLLDCFEQQDLTRAYQVFCDKVLPLSRQQQEQEEGKGDVGDDDLLLFHACSRDDCILRYFVDAGISLIRAGQLQTGFQQFRKGVLDPRELLSIFPTTKMFWSPTRWSNKLIVSPLRQAVFAEGNDDVECKRLLAEFCRASPRRSFYTDVAVFTLYLSMMVNPTDEEKDLKSLVDDFTCPTDDERGDGEEEEEEEETIKRMVAQLQDLGLHDLSARLLARLNKPREALQVWSEMQNQEQGLSATIEFLKNQHSLNPELVWVFSSWVLQKDPLRGLEIFRTSDPTLVPERVITHLRQFDPSRDLCLVLLYLNFLASGDDPDARSFDLELGVEFVETFPRASRNLGQDFFAFVSRPSTLRGTTEQTTEAELIIRRIEQQQQQHTTRDEDKSFLQRVKIVLYSKCGWHHQALSILVNDFDDLAGAEEYCVHNFRSEGNSRNPFLDLLVLYFSPENANGERFRNASLDILERHGHCIDPAQVIQKLPADLKVGELSTYLSIMLSRNVRKICRLQVEKNLCVAQNIKVRNNLQKKHKRNLTITLDTKCSVCNQPIGETAFLNPPPPKREGVVHYKCFFV